MIPGLIAMLGYMVAIADLRPARSRPGAGRTTTRRRRVDAAMLGGVLPIAVIFLLVFGGIYGGWFTPTEGAAVGAAATFLAALLKGEMTWRKFKRVLLRHGRERRR